MFFKAKKNTKGDFKLFAFNGVCNEIIISDNKSEITFSKNHIQVVCNLIFNEYSSFVYSDKTKRVYKTINGVINLIKLYE